MHLIVGATGMLGAAICRRLASQGRGVRALARKGSDPQKVASLQRLGAEIALGDLKDRASIEAACRGATVVVSTTSSTVSRREGDSIETVDRDGQLALVEAAERAGARHFVFISFPPVELDIPLQSAKRAVEERLRAGRIGYTILQPTCFMEVWLSPALGLDLESATARIYGAGNAKISWISFEDVAKFAAASIDNSRALDAVVKLGGPDALAPLEVVRVAEQIIGKKIATQHVPEETLRAQYDAAADPLQKSFAGLMLYYARGDVIDMTETARAFGVEPLRSVREHLGVVAQRTT
jgi:uncharacterized protein YbjT (DUF2867 family)